MQNMKQSQIERVYAIAPHALFGACLTALGHMRAQLEEHDAEHGTIRAVIRGRPLTAATELSLRITAEGPTQARLIVGSRAGKNRGDQRAATTLLQLVDQLLAQV